MSPRQRPIIIPHERSDLSHWRKRLGDRLELVLAESLRVAHEAGAASNQVLSSAELPVNESAQLKREVARFL